MNTWQHCIRLRASSSTPRCGARAGCNARVTPALCLVAGLSFFAAGTTCAARTCDDADRLTTLQVNECLSAEYVAADEDLNRVYRAILSELATRAGEGDSSSGTARESLIAAEKAWVQFRDAECSARYDYFLEGTIRNSTALECKIDLTKARIAKLHWWVDVLRQ